MNEFKIDSLDISKLPPAWPKGLFTFVLIISILIGAAAFGLNYFNSLEQKKLDTLTNEFENLRAAFPVDQEKEIATFEAKLTTLVKLLNNHVYFSNVIRILETLTHPQVSYSSLNYSVDKNTINLNGLAKNQQVLSEAVNGFINDPQDIKMVILKDMKTNSDFTVNFNLDIILNSQVLKYQTAL